MTAQRPHSVSVAGVIVDDHGRALLIKRRDNGHWEPPGGVLEPGETIPEALQREVLEETGIKIALPATLTGVYKNMTALIVSMVFRCEAIDGTPTIGEETRELRWVTREEVSEPVIHEPVNGGADASMADAETVEPQAANVTSKRRAAKGAVKPLFQAPAGEPDDLKKITGVGPVLEQKLRDLGITRYDQIAAFSGEDVENIDKALNIKGRVQRDDWVGQAKTLAAG